ncbi:MAG: MmgE/PrpD family protein, partial [Deltaproteobacteria bacterium]|nr:MmgE/PrpD family protein [Deltaproteobacteria bacterium]
MTNTATSVLARYAVDLRYRELPSEVISRAKDCLLDILTVSLYGSTKPWSKHVVQHIKSMGLAGRSTVLGNQRRAPAHLAALANGTMAHAFELDNVRQPGAGVHPGATAFLPALAVAEERRVDGKAFLTACIAACEVMSRIGVAAGNSLEHRGFHAPGVTGPFGAAVAAGRLLGLDEKKMVSAMGIAGSYCGGLMEFSRCEEGAMVKRLHLGRAAEGGVTAAFLAHRGFAGPESVLEGKFGVCQAFSDSPQLSRLTYRLGREFESLNICVKRYACHINAHAPIEALEYLCRENDIEPGDIKEITVAGIEKLVTHHAIYRPKNLMSAQYSIPFCVALSLFHDPQDPESFTEKRVGDKNILAMMRRVRLRVDAEIEKKGWDRAARVTVSLKGGGHPSTLVVHFKGTPHNPMSPAELEEKARKLTRRFFGEKKLARLVETVRNVEK